MTWLQLSSVALTLISAWSTVAATHHEVTVGAGGQLKFIPETLNAQVGDQITYRFFAKNHSVVQSTFAEPCRPQIGGFFSGFVANPSQDDAAPTTFTIHVNDTKPIWVYCGQRNNDHCQNGMVHAINASPEGTNTFSNFKSAASNAQRPSLTPSDGLPVGGVRKLHVDVGSNGNLVFDPSNVAELPRTVIEFSFNPANHSIVQSSFDAPCQPLDGGFSTPFVPTQQAPSGVTFEVVVKDTKPIWFYCAQTAKTHCQAGMVGSINAATTGDKTFEAFKQLAAKAPASNLPTHQPNVGVLKVNGTAVYNVNGVVFDSTKTGWDSSIVTDVPAPGYTYSPYMVAMAGGSVPENYGWTDRLSSNATEYLQAMQLMDHFVVQVLFEGYSKLRQGEWTGIPESIISIFGSMFAQALIQRSTYIESLQHFNKPTINGCKFNIDSSSFDEWLQTSLTATTLSTGAVMDIITQVEGQDHWMIAALATALGSKARMSAVINMMQNHMAASAPREVLIPVELALGYVRSKYAVGGTCGPEADSLNSKADLPALNITAKETQSGTGRLTSITVSLPSSNGSRYVAWIGPWGGIKYSDLDADGKTVVPEGLSGHVWIAVTSAKGMRAKEISHSALTAIEKVWVVDPWGHDG
ncbi:uncharacterized protein JN550_000990 [Neoarthrinium moseri]|uniref:uncharacterized protein n=1 Tax=Neoarthrinium moseri TaxID=1658444 RepID=UPI001FDC07E6|nr:uncharacterized protein JN550_000990 [Neoarthrinium moseri]KAI1876918.1 hypothetical protein JN550_000990 [Neoarthrinium moseri]